MPLNKKDIKRMRKDFNRQLSQYHEAVYRYSWKQKMNPRVKLCHFNRFGKNPPEEKNVDEQTEDRCGVKPKRVRMIPPEEYFDVLLDLHLSTGHGGSQDMLEKMKAQEYIPMSAIHLFTEVCKICQNAHESASNGDSD